MDTIKRRHSHIHTAIFARVLDVLFSTLRRFAGEESGFPNGVVHDDPLSPNPKAAAPPIEARRASMARRYSIDAAQSAKDAQESVALARGQHVEASAVTGTKTVFYFPLTVVKCHR